MKIQNLFFYFFYFFNFVFFSTASSNVHDSTIFAKYPNKHFVETGTWVGIGVTLALKAGFQEVHTIELSPYFYQFCIDLFKNNPNVHIWFGDSGKILKDVISQIDEPITFWLDGHWCADDSNNPSCGVGAPSYKGEEYTPLLSELEAIKAHPIKTHTILIDDVRCFDTYLFQGLSLKTVLEKIKEINSNYKIRFEDGAVANDILVAYIEE